MKEKKSGTSCYQVSATSESLELGLGQGLRSALGPAALASSAYLDVELKGSARILATARLGGAVVGTFELQSGSSIGQPSVADHTPFACNSSSDSGPDSGVRDNCRWPVSAPSWTGTRRRRLLRHPHAQGPRGVLLPRGWRRRRRAAPGTVPTPNASIIELATDTLGCGETSKAAVADGDAPQVTVLRLPNADGAEPCRVVPYAIGNGPRYAQFVKPVNSQTSAQFLWNLTWKAAPTAGSAALPALKIDYEYPSGDTTPEVTTLGWCPDATYDANGQFIGYAGRLPIALDQEPDLDGTQFACLVSRQAVAKDGVPSTAADYVSVNDKVYVYGDAKMQW